MFIVSRKNFGAILEKLYERFSRDKFDVLKKPEELDDENNAYGIAGILEAGNDVCISEISHDKKIENG